MNRSDSIKQIIICAIIVLTFVIGAFIVKKYFVSDDNDFGDNTEVKDKYEYNEFELSNVTDEVIIQRYFIDFKEKMLNDTEEAYKLLTADAKAIYKSYSEFKYYVDNNREVLNSSHIVKYNVQKGKSTVKYEVIDQYNNQYTFISKAVLVYSVNIELYDENPSIFK